MKRDLDTFYIFSLVKYDPALYICPAMKNSAKYKKRMSSIFLCAYLAFVITNAIHFHAYSLFDDPSIKDYSKQSPLNNHFLGSNLSFCTISHFSNSILDLKYSSSNLSQFLNEREELKLVISDRFTSKFFFTKNSSRAPPAIS
jgi:hypothetical protein